MMKRLLTCLFVIVALHANAQYDMYRAYQPNIDKKELIKGSLVRSKYDWTGITKGIVKVMDYFETNNTCYYVMEYLCGGDLDTLIEKRGGLSEEDTIRYTKQIGSALSFMHKNKMLHLDLKPKNVMLNAAGDAILIDFGLSKQYDSSGEPESSTTVGRGTPGYAPLEQANYQDGHGFPVTMDVYALGATMYKMLTSVRAPEASVILNEGFPIDNINKTCTSHLLNCIIKAMSPLKKDRFQSIEEILNDFNLDIVEHVEKEKQIKFIFIENGKIIPLHILCNDTNLCRSYCIMEKRR